MKKRLIATLLVATMGLSLMTACGSEETTEATATTEETAEEAETETVDSIVSEPTELTFIFADGDEGAKESITKIVDDFNATYEDITVTIEPGNGGTYSEFLKTKDSVGEFPDIMEMRDTATYVRAGKLAPLSDEIVSLFTSVTEYDGEVYTAPMSGENTDGIIYNKKYFEENGLEEPQTYEEFLELCQTIEDLGDMAPIIVGGEDLWHMGFWFHKAYADQVLSEDEDFITHCYEGTADFSDEKFVATFEELQDIMQYAQDGWASTPDAQITTFLVNDMGAMIYSGTHMFSTIEEADPDFEYGWFAIPSPDGKTRLVGGGGSTGLAISAEAAQDPNKLAAGEAFIKFFFAKENYKNYLETLSFMPTTVDQPELEVSDVYQEVIDAVNSADYLSPMWNGFTGTNELPPDFRNFTYKTLIEVLQGTRDIDSAVEEINKTWNTSIESFNPVTGVGITAE